MPEFPFEPISAALLIDSSVSFRVSSILDLSNIDFINEVILLPVSASLTGKTFISFKYLS